VTDEQKLLGLSILVVAVIIGVMVALTVNHVIRDRRARAVNRALNADHRPREKP
jgi:hypothetical protein